MEPWQRAYEKGFALFPVVWKSKVPATEHGFRDATRDLTKLEIYFNQPQNIGVRTGSDSWLTVVDLDPPHLDNFFELFPKCLDETYTVKTGSGGYHLYYQYIQKMISRRYTICDVKNDGGFVVGAGSLHENGNYYELLHDRPVAAMTEDMKYEIYKYHPISVEQPTGFTTAQIWDLIDMSVFKKDGSGNYRGPHPEHGSESGNNFLITSDGRFWHCWRHGISGGRRKLQRILAGEEVCR